MKFRTLLPLLLSLIIVGCFRRYKFTGKICGDKLYVEFYEVNPAGVDAEYITDSINFRHYIGTFDEEHERYAYDCKGDSIYIKKFGHGNGPISDTIETLLEQKVVDLRDLKARHKFD